MTREELTRQALREVEGIIERTDAQGIRSPEQLIGVILGGVDHLAKNELRTVDALAIAAALIQLAREVQLAAELRKES